jgi:hypothetical protein
MQENLAEQIDPIEDVDKNDESKPMPTTVDKAKLTKNELKALEDGQTTTKKLGQERDQLKQSAKAEMRGLLQTGKGKDVVELGDYKDLKQELSDIEKEMAETGSPEKMKELLDQIRDIPRRRQQEKANQQEQEASEKEKLDENDPRLKDLKEKFTKICKDNEHLIGGGDINGYIKWFEGELRKHPTVAYGKEVIDRLEGKRVFDNEGLAPRRKVYNELEQAFKKHGLDSPLKSKFIKQEGLQERKDFLQGIKLAETEVKRVNDSFWSPKAKKAAMQEILMAKNPGDQKDITKQISKISQIESEGFIYMKNTMNVGGTTVRKMSDASIDAFLLGLKGEGSIKKRLEYVTGNGKYSNGMKEAVENEASLYGKELKPEVAKLFGLTKGLEGIYKDNPEGLKLAIQSFEKLDFMKKIQALKDHERLVAKETNKEELEKKLTVKAAEVSINEAARKGEIASSTKKKYNEWFQNEDNYKDPKTEKPGSLEVLKKYYDVLTNSEPDGKSRNLSAYRVKRDRFKNEVKGLKLINPDMDEKELKKWQDEYDKKGWTDRKKVYKDIKREQEKQQKSQDKRKEAERAAGLQEGNKEKGEKLNKEETIKSSMALINEDQPAEALKTLMEYNDANPDDKDIIFWMEVALKRIKEFGSGKKREEEETKQVEEEIDSIASSDEKMKDRIEEENLTTLNLDAARQSENRHEKKVSGQDRAEKESMAKASGEMEKDLTEDFYSQTDDQHILNKEGTGEKMSEIKFDGVDMTDQERQKLKDNTRKHETQILDKTGFTHIDIKDKSGKKISAQQAESEQAARLEQLENELAEKALEKTAKKEGKSTDSGATIYDLTTRMAAKRKAKDLLDKERHSHERLKNAA